MSCRAQTTLNVTNFGAMGGAVQFHVNTVSNSSVVSVAGTNVFSAADIGKVIEVFGAGPQLQFSNDPPWSVTTLYGSNPNNGTVVTQQDIICLVTGVSNGTNLSLSIPCGYTMNAYCVVGANNAPAFQGAINAASSLVAGGQYTNVTINIPGGTYLIVSSQVLNPDYVMSGISETHPALTVSSGGITFLGQSATNTILMGCGAGMDHRINSTFPYGSLGFFNPMRDTLIWCQGPVANNQYPLVFQNLTMDGGLLNGAQSYNYWTLQEGNGEGWDTTHHAVADSNPYPATPQMNQLKVFTNCVFQHWRGEMLICWTGPGGTNTFNDIADCTFYDGNATADNMYYGQHVHGCVFNQVEKVTEYYQANATLPTVFENNLMTNIAGNMLVINGATTNAVPPSYTIQGNTFYGIQGDDILFTPAENVVVSNNVFHGQETGISFSAAGLQPANGSAAVMSNVVIVANTFNDTFIPILTDGYPVEDVLVSNNSSSTTYSFAQAGGGWKTNWVFAGNTGTASLNSTAVQAGSYFEDAPSDNLAWYQYNDWAGVNNSISYGNGHKHLIIHVMTNSVFQIIPNSFDPPGAVLVISNATASTISISPGISLPPGRGVNLLWNGSAWNTTPAGGSSGTNTTLRFTAGPTNGATPLAVQFNSPGVDSGGNTIVSWNWNFGDGTTSTAQNPSHTYTAVGTFNLILTATNSAGLSPASSGPAIVVNGPKLGLTITGGKLILAWPTNAVGYTLQCTTNLMPPVVWITVSSAPVVVNGQNVVSNSISGPQMFFRMASM